MIGFGNIKGNRYPVLDKDILEKDMELDDTEIYRFKGDGRTKLWLRRKNTGEIIHISIFQKTRYATGRIMRHLYEQGVRF